MQYADWEFEKQFRREKNRLLMFASPNWTGDRKYMNKDESSGYIIKMGAGIRAQMDKSNTVYYNTFSIPFLTQHILELMAGKEHNGMNKFVIRTGLWGLYQFHVELENYTKLYTPLNVQSRVSTAKGGSGIQKGADMLKYSGFFQVYQGPGFEVTLMHEPLYDDAVRNKVMHPDGGLAESRRMDILNVSQIDGEPNIRKVFLKGEDEFMGFEPGMRDPFQANSPRRVQANAKDAYKMHRMLVCGAMIKDPTKTMSFIPNILK